MFYIQRHTHNIYTRIPIIICKNSNTVYVNINILHPKRIPRIFKTSRAPELLTLRLGYP